MNVHKAAKQGKLEWLQQHVGQKGRSALNERDKKGDTPLTIAVKEQQDDVISFLLENNVDVNVADKDGMTALLHAIVSGCSQDMVQDLLNHKANVNAADNKGFTALHWATHLQQEELMNLLLEKKADPKRKTKAEGYTPLHFAANEGSTTAVQTLLEHGADKDARDSVGNTPIFGAIHMHNEQAIRALVASGCDLDIQNGEQETVVHWLAREGDDNINFLKYILERKPNVNLQNKEGDTPLHLANSNGHMNIAKILLEHGASIDIKNNKDLTPEEIKVITSAPKPATSGQPVTPVAGEKSRAKERRTPKKSAENDEAMQWLQNLGMERYSARFKRKGVGMDLDVIASLRDTDLKKMNIPSPDRKTIAGAVARLAKERGVRRAEVKKTESLKGTPATKGSNSSYGKMLAILILLMAIALYAAQRQ